MGIISEDTVIVGAGDPNSRLAVVAHPDDDLLFMFRDIQTQIDAGLPMTVIYTTGTAGGDDVNRWQDREAAAKAAYQTMIGSSSGVWIDQSVIVEADGEQYTIASSYFSERPEIRLYFLRIPDGGVSGLQDQSLEKLWMGEISEATAVGPNDETYTKENLTDLLRELFAAHQPATIMEMDSYSRFSSTAENSDHVHTARFTTLASQSYADMYNHSYDIDVYLGYKKRFVFDRPIALNENVFGDEFEKAKAVFDAYIARDPSVLNPDKPVESREQYYNWLKYFYKVGDQGAGTNEIIQTYWTASYGYNSGGKSPEGGWQVNQHARMLGDINGDGTADFVGLNETGIFVSTASVFTLNDQKYSGFGFDERRLASDEIRVNGGWDAARHEIELGDINGDGADDVIIFGETSVSVLHSNELRAFLPKETYSNLDWYTYGSGWRIGKHDREVGDVNKDGFADIIGFAEHGVFISTNNQYNDFNNIRKINNEEIFKVRDTNNNPNDNFDPTKHIRQVGDVNGDGRDDIVVFHNNGVHVSLAYGNEDNVNFSSSTLWINNFGYNAGGWLLGKNDRFLADVNGDGSDDIVGFGNNGILVSLSLANPSNPNSQNSFAGTQNWNNSDIFKASSWDSTKWIRDVADVDGDGRADIVWTDNYGVRVALSNGENNFKIFSVDDLAVPTAENLSMRYSDLLSNDVLYSTDESQAQRFEKSSKHQKQQASATKAIDISDVLDIPSNNAHGKKDVLESFQIDEATKSSRSASEVVRGDMSYSKLVDTTAALEITNTATQTYSECV